MAAILQSANILANNAAQYQNANARIFDAITNAANAYEERQRLRIAALDKERERMATQQAEQQKLMLDPEKVTMAVLQKAQLDPNSVTPAEKAAFEAAQKTLGAKMALDPLGRAYNAYQPIPLGGAPRPADLMAPVVREEPLAAPAAIPTAASFMTAPSGTLLPPPAAGQQGDMELFNKPAEAPAPIGQAEIKKSAVSQVAPPKMIQGAGGPVPDPVDMERYKAELAAAKEADVGGAKTEAEKKAADFGKNKLQNIISEMQRVNEELRKAGGLKTTEQGIIGRGIDAARNLAIPVPFSAGGLEVGRTVENVADPKVAKLKQEYERLRALGFQFYKNASGLSASQMNTEKEQQLALSVFGDTSGFYEANKSALENLAREYGAGGGKEQPKKEAGGSLQNLTKLPEGFKDIGNGMVQGPDGKKYRIKR